MLPILWCWEKICGCISASSWHDLCPAAMSEAEAQGWLLAIQTVLTLAVILFHCDTVTRLELGARI